MLGSRAVTTAGRGAGRYATVLGIGVSEATEERLLGGRKNGSKERRQCQINRDS